MRSYGLTKARSMGPVADLVERSGGSIARVFRRAELPLRLIEEPDRLNPSQGSTQSRRMRGAGDWR